MSERQRPSQQHRNSRHAESQSSPPPRPEHPSKPPLADATQLVGQLNQSLSELTEELKQGKSERLEQYLSFAARFHHYSRGNQWLIQAQMPTATRVASYSKWQEEGYQVAEGVHGIRILAPSNKKLRPSRPICTPEPQPPEQSSTQQEAEQTEQEQQVEQGSAPDMTPKTILRFVAVSVFDVSQLTPEKRPPEFFTPLHGESDALYQRLVEAATTDGFAVAQSDYTQGAEGYSQGRRIVTRSDLASVNRTLTTLHEYAHALLHQGLHPIADRIGGRRDLTEISSSLKECHAEATAYIVAKHFGLPTPFSADYLLQWGTTPESLRNELDVVLTAASHIIGQVEGVKGEEQQLESPDPLSQEL